MGKIHETSLDSGYYLGPGVETWERLVRAIAEAIGVPEAEVRAAAEPSSGRVWDCPLCGGVTDLVPWVAHGTCPWCGARKGSAARPEED